MATMTAMHLHSHLRFVTEQLLLTMISDFSSSSSNATAVTSNTNHHHVPYQLR
uniref:Uncharacterized protein n=1 Tax=Arion vulgaris TaxID=1028688 RepID=A0A0B7A7Y7_9EUPU